MRHLKYNKECEYCKKQFIATRKDAKYCSNACASISYRFRAEKKLNDLRLEAIKISAEVLGENEEELIQKLIPENKPPIKCWLCKNNAKYIFGKEGQTAGYISLCKEHAEKEGSPEKIANSGYSLIKEL